MHMHMYIHNIYMPLQRYIHTLISISQIECHFLFNRLYKSSWDSVLKFAHKSFHLENHVDNDIFMDYTSFRIRRVYIL